MTRDAAAPVGAEVLEKRVHAIDHAEVCMVRNTPAAFV
jgi:hypothetical protein